MKKYKITLIDSKGFEKKIVLDKKPPLKYTILGIVANYVFELQDAKNYIYSQTETILNF